MADLLWSDRGADQARASVRQAVHELRHLENAGSAISAPVRDTVSLNAELVTTDLWAIRCAAEASDFEVLEALLGSSEAGLLIDLDGLDPEFDAWLRIERANEPSRTLIAALAAAERCLETDGPEAASGIVAQVQRLDPCLEESARLAMRIAHGQGDSGSLHRHFRMVSERLRADFDIDPSDETRRLFDELSRGAAAPSRPVDRPGDGDAIGSRVVIEAFKGETTSSVGSGAELRAGWPTRRTVAAGLLAAGVAGTGGFLLTRDRRPPVSSEVQALMVQAQTAELQGDREGQLQAISLFQRVVALAPGYADGWAALALAYRDAAQFRTQAENDALRERARAAGQRALDIDPGNGLGQAMVAAAIPHRRGWLQIEHGLRRALATGPGNEMVILCLGILLTKVGRFAEAVDLHRMIHTRPLLPAHYWTMSHALWGANRIEELDRLIAEASQIYPIKQIIWFVRLKVWLLSGRTSQAIALMTDRDSFPTGLADSDLAKYVSVARAAESRDPADVDRVMKLWMALARAGSVYAEYAINIACLLGRIDEAFAAANAYYFGRGFAVPDRTNPGSRSYKPMNERDTMLLFQPPARPMRGDPRFRQLTEELGLEHYWRAAGEQPDYRQA